MGSGKNRPEHKVRSQPTIPFPLSKRRVRRQTVRYAVGEPELFANLSEGERAETLRILIEDKRLINMAKVGRYRVIAVEPLVVKPPHPLTGQRLASVVVYDYAADRCVHACVDLTNQRVEHVIQNRGQPMLAREEEIAAIDIALRDTRVSESLSLGDEPLAAMHYWSNQEKDLSYSRRSAAVIFGQKNARPAVVAIVNLIDKAVADVVPAEEW